MKRKLILLVSVALSLAKVGNLRKAGKALLALTALLLLASVVLAQSGGDYDVEWNVMGSAGDQFVSGGNYQIGFTLAQEQEPLISSGGSYQIVQGYWAGGGFPPTAVKVYLPLILKEY